MNTSTWLALIGLILGGGGGTQLITKLTRLVVAVEQLTEANKKIIGEVDNHEKRLNKGGL